VSPAGFHSVPELKSTAAAVDAYDKTTKLNNRSPSAIYNAMVHPLAPFAMRGAIWYQGESNGNEGESYYHKTQALVNGWRKLFNPDLAFYWVQLADFRAPNEDPAGGDGWAKLREAQRKALTIKHTGMAVITDIGNAKDIHPRNKQDVGWRLSQWALHQTYGKKDLVPSGPLFKAAKPEGSAIRVSFDNVGSGLMVGKKVGLSPTEHVKDGTLARFAIAGADKKWHWADAKIDGADVVLTSSEVDKPVAVRYAYSTNPAGANLYNKEGIPASPFRSDDW
jgi:sialate O-acetylesterase